MLIVLYSFANFPLLLLPPPCSSPHTFKYLFYRFCLNNLCHNTLILSLTILFFASVWLITTKILWWIYSSKKLFVIESWHQKPAKIYGLLNNGECKLKIKCNIISKQFKGGIAVGLKYKRITRNCDFIYRSKSPKKRKIKKLLRNVQIILFSFVAIRAAKIA